MKKMLSNSILGASLIVACLVPSSAMAVSPNSSFAQVNVFDSVCQGANRDQPICNSGQRSLSDLIGQISTTMLFLLGAIAVVMIIIGGIRYTTSGGDPQQTKAAKDTVLYAVIGLVVALLAYAIVAFIVKVFVPAETT